MTPYLGWRRGKVDREAFVDVVGPEMRAGTVGTLTGSMHMRITPKLCLFV